jgi:hypothetical protein
VLYQTASVFRPRSISTIRSVSSLRAATQMHHNHIKTEFQVWNGPCNWFWYVPYDHGGAVGAALTEMEAIREACAAIDKMSMLPASNAIGNRVQ